MLSYHEFTEKYADVVEQFMAIQSMDRSKEFLLQRRHPSPRERFQLPTPCEP